MCVCFWERWRAGSGALLALTATSAQARLEAGHLRRILLHDGGPPRLHRARQRAVVDAAVGCVGVGGVWGEVRSVSGVCVQGKNCPPPAATTETAPLIAGRGLRLPALTLTHLKGSCSTSNAATCSQRMRAASAARTSPPTTASTSAAVSVAWPAAQHRAGGCQNRRDASRWWRRADHTHTRACMHACTPQCLWALKGGATAAMPFMHAPRSAASSARASASATMSAPSARCPCPTSTAV